MTDTPSQGAPPAASTPPIVVSANPNQAVVEALFRVLVTNLGLVTGAFGLAKATGALRVVGDMATPIVAVVFALCALASIVIGALKTHALATAALPSTPVTTKPSWLSALLPGAGK